MKEKPERRPLLKFIIRNLTGRRVWLSMRHDFYKDVVHICLHEKPAPMKPNIELYEDLLDGQYITLGRPEWSESTHLDLDDSHLDPKPKLLRKNTADKDGAVRIFTLKTANGAN